jgi:FkbM family methyltransferase
MIGRLFRHLSLTHANLPYNFNWRLTGGGPFTAFLDRNPIILADIGARGDCPEEIEGLKPHIDYYAFEADAEESARLSGKGFHSSHIFPAYVGATPGTLPFHIYKRPGESSAFLPSPRFREHFNNAGFAVERTVEVECRRLDDLIADAGLAFPDFIKLDVQGSELSILQASPRALAGAVMVEVEVEFVEVYEGQPAFHEVCAFMAANRFEILYLNRVFGQRAGYRGSARGQLIFGDVLFGRREDALAGFSPEAIAKYVVLLTNYGHRDYAAELLRQFPDVRALIPGAGSILKPTNRFKQLLATQYDKLIFLLLALRTSNQLRHESDRSWPVR